jgi:DNA-binding MarR family transcriptional regulator
MEGKAGIDSGLRNLADIDRLVHEPARLMILMVLYTVEEADFTFLINATELTDGNLSSHLSKLEAAGYVEIEKGYAGKKPRTRLRLTTAGRQAVENYRSTMQQALRNLEG